MKHLCDIDGTVHCEGPDGADYTLCGLALEGERGNTPMKETASQIDCNQCIAVISFCQRVRGSEIILPFARRQKRPAIPARC